LAHTDVTVLLDQADRGDPAALNRLVPLIYDELRALARRHRRRNGGSETVNTTAVVHEAYEKLASYGVAGATGRTHFFRIAGRAMRDVLVDHARAQRAQKRGGPGRAASLDAVGPVDAGGLRVDEVVAVDDALRRLDAFDPRQARVVECRYFAGMTVGETADALGVSSATVKRDWITARAWLHRAMTT
jgi:RNA polymerase sigma factor (TIGR02999 family)